MRNLFKFHYDLLVRDRCKQRITWITRNASTSGCSETKKPCSYFKETKHKIYSKYSLFGTFVSVVLLLSFTQWTKLDENFMYKQNEEAKEKKKRTGFRDRKVIEYENRIRRFSTPEKVFRYFATLIVENPHSSKVEICMTPDDFLRSLIPGIKQPDDLGLDKYKRCDSESVDTRKELNLDKDNIFYKLGSNGLITFSDYMFLLVVLSTDRRHFEMAFRVFDLDRDGNVDAEEFSKIASLFSQRNSIKSRYRDTFNSGIHSALMTYFFGKKMEQKLSIEKFLDFQHQLKRQLLDFEFNRKNSDGNGNITELNFTKLVLAYARYSNEKRVQVLKRIKKKFKNNSPGISKEEYLRFFHVLDNIAEVETALTFYHVAGASVDPDTFKHVTKIVANVDLSDHLIDVVYTIFDENMDGELSHKEFVSVMKKRALRGLNVPRDTGFSRFMEHTIRNIVKYFSNT